ncbi:Protein kinase domain-containing protein [Cladophialophora immunda]|nr:Protein kinase domain-containing protein [Cladophialophora immunda]
MDFFQPYYHFSLGNLPSRSAVSKKLGREGDHTHPPLLRLLSIAEALEVNVLPLTWRPALEGLGRGATSQIRQSPLNAQISLAFKRFGGAANEIGDMAEVEWRARQYDAIVSEVMALSTPKIYDHPNIANLEGICWEVETVSGEIWPVLAFRKAECGSLDNFLSLPDAKDMDFDDLIDICGEVAKGLRIMHLCNIVHGDIKPENILVFKSVDSGVYGIKITDFGYSSFGSSESDEVKLPLSRPWEAPEYHDRWFQLKAAKISDVYSFGLLALWLLFRDETLILDNGMEIKVSEAFADTEDFAMARLQRSKRDGTLLDATLKLTAQKADLTDRQRPLDTESDIPHSTFEQNLSWHGNVQIRNFFFDLDSCDYRIQGSLAKDLEEMAQTQECPTCQNNAAFQLALCYSFGFGVRAHTGTSDEWLSRSGKERMEFDAVISDMRHMAAPTSAIRQIINLGYQSQLADDYEVLGILEPAIAEYRAMATSREKAFGPEHFSTRRMWAQLADLLQRADDLTEASEIYLQQLSVLAREHGPDQDAGILKSKLARTYAEMKKFDEAESMARQSFDSYNPESEHDHALRLAALCDLAFIALESERHDIAIERAEKTVQEGQQYLGQAHRVTLRARGILALAYSGKGETQKAVVLMESVIAERKESLGPEHPDTINFIKRIGPLYVDLGNWTKARDRFKELVDALKRADPPELSEKETTEVLVAQSNYAGALARTGDADTAATLLEQVIAGMSKLLEPGDVKVVSTKANLAIAYQYQGRWEDAAPLQQEVATDFQHRFGFSDRRTLMAMANLSDTLYTRKKWKEVADLSIEEGRLRETVSSKPSEAILTALYKAARSCFRLNDWLRAVPLLEKEVQTRIQLSEMESIEGLEATALLALGYLQLARTEAAKPYIGDFFDLFLRINKAREMLVEIIYALATAAETCGLLEEAEELLKLAVLIRRALSSAPREDAQDSRDEERIQDLRQRQNRPLEDVRFDPTAIIERTRTFRDNPNPSVFAQVWKSVERWSAHLGRAIFLQESTSGEDDGWKQAWKDHFKRDLEPYVCISEECSSNLQYFVSLRDWRHHMNSQHTLDWIEEIHRPATWFCETGDHDYQHD